MAIRSTIGFKHRSACKENNKKGRKKTQDKSTGDGVKTQKPKHGDLRGCAHSLQHVQ